MIGLLFLSVYLGIGVAFVIMFYRENKRDLLPDPQRVHAELSKAIAEVESATSRLTAALPETRTPEQAAGALQAIKDAPELTNRILALKREADLCTKYRMASNLTIWSTLIFIAIFWLPIWIVEPYLNKK